MSGDRVSSGSACQVRDVEIHCFPKGKTECGAGRVRVPTGRRKGRRLKSLEFTEDAWVSRGNGVRQRDARPTLRNYDRRIREKFRGSRCKTQGDSYTEEKKKGRRKSVGVIHVGGPESQAGYSES